MKLLNCFSAASVRLYAEHFSTLRSSIIVGLSQQLLSVAILIVRQRSSIIVGLSQQLLSVAMLMVRLLHCLAKLLADIV